MKLKIPAFAKLIAWVKNITDRDPSLKKSEPHRDWQRLLVLFFAALLGSGLLHFFIYSSLSDTAPGSVEASKRTINEKEFTRVLEAYREKELLFNELRSAPPTIEDPSR